MKTIYEILYPFGCSQTEVKEDFEVKFPYTGVVPDPARDQMLQFFDVKSNVWRPVEYMANTEKLALLENFYTTVKNENIQLTDKQAKTTELNAKLMLNDINLVKENTTLKQKADNLAQINSKTMLASIQNSKDIAEIKAQLTTENKEGGK
ncbi:hypothetical protein SAMN04487821_12491 [Enterococcus malodoratus]|uniref:hypothetical protein n=1 Tax=Enterococcus malodoratus TaxID=71451 RepID=UPI0008CC9177|nr:hypothetical protein [Enterococcus malodoratus]SET84097.1 hypothetical protein SAMN04487821_12491 [Enterococcus malodoratus]